MKKTIIVMLVISVLYFLSINVVRDYMVYNSLNQNQTTDSKMIDEREVPIGHSVGISVKRPRWYGTIYEYPDIGIKDLKLLNIVYLPLRYRNINFLIPHLIVIFSWFMLIPIYLIKEIIKGGETWEEH